MVKSLINRLIKPAPVEITLNAVNLIRGRTYLLVIDLNTTTREAAAQIQKKLKEKRIKTVIVAVNTPGGKIEVIDAELEEMGTNKEQ